MPLVIEGSQTGAFYSQRNTNKGVKPYLNPNQFNLAKYTVTSGFHPTHCYALHGSPGVLKPAYIDTRLYGKYWDAIKSESGALVGVTIAESRQAWGMMDDRLNQLAGLLGLLKVDEWDLARLRRRKAAMNPKRAKRLRSLPPKPMRHRTHLKNGGSWWLEFWLGWSALINDLYESYKFLAEFEGIHKIDVKTGGTWRHVTGAYPTGTIPTSAVGQLRKVYENKSFVRFGADIKVSDPDAYALLALGLSNPAEVALELVSKSFVVNWFATLNEFMSQFNSRFGFTISRGYHTVFESTLATITYRVSSGMPLQTGTIERVIVNRMLQSAPPGPSLVLRPFKGFSLTRGATASALVLQYLKEVPKL